MKAYMASTHTQSKIDTQQTDILDESDRSLYNQMLEDIQDKESIPSPWNKIKKKIMPKFFKKSPKERESQPFREYKEKPREFARKAQKAQMPGVNKRRVQTKKDHSRPKPKNKPYRRKTKRIRQVNGKATPKVGPGNFQDIRLNEVNPYDLAVDPDMPVVRASRKGPSQIVTLRSQDFDQVFRLRKEFDQRQQAKKKKYSYMSNKPLDLKNLKPDKSKEKSKRAAKSRNLTGLKGDFKTSNISSSRTSSISLKKQASRNKMRTKSGLQFKREKKQQINLSINSSFSSDIEMAKGKRKKDPRWKLKGKTKVGKEQRNGNNKGRGQDFMMFTLTGKNTKDFGEKVKGVRDSSRYSTKRMKVIKKKSNFQNFMEKIEKIEKIDKVEKKRQKDERVNNEYFRSRKGSQPPADNMDIKSNRYSIRNETSPLENLISLENNEPKVINQVFSPQVQVPRTSLKASLNPDILRINPSQETKRLRPIWNWVETLNQEELSDVLNQLTQCKVY